MSEHEPQRTFLGMPVHWDWRNATKSLWNRDDDRLFPPKRLGVGWSVNFHAVLKRLRLAK